MRPAFVPFAILATAVLAVNNLLLPLRAWPLGQFIIPVVALLSLAVALALWWRGD